MMEEGDESIIENGVFLQDMDMHLYIFAYLTLEELKVASIVCKAWSSVCHSRALWRRMFLRDVLFNNYSSFGVGKTLDWRQLYRFCFTFPRVAKKLFKAEIASGALRKYLNQMGHYEDDDINCAVSQIVRKYLRAVVVEDISSLLGMKEAIRRYSLPCVCLETLQNFPVEPLVHFDTGGPCNCLGNAVNAIVCPPEFEHLRVPLFSQLIGGNVVIFGSDTAASDIQPESEVRYVSRSQIFSKYSFVSVHKSIKCSLGSGPVASTIQMAKRKYAKMNNNETNTTESSKLLRTDHGPAPSPSPSPSPSSSSSSLSTSSTTSDIPSFTEYADLLKLDISFIVDLFQVDRVTESLRCVHIQRLGSVAMVNKEWGKEEITELREKLEQFKPSFVLGVREDIFSIKKNIDLEGSAFPTPEKLKEAIFELSPIGSIVRPRMIFVRQIEYTHMIKAALPKKFRNTMYCYLQNLPINMDPVLYPGRRNLQDLIDIDDNFADLSVGFYLKSTLLCDRLSEALELITADKIMQTRRKVMFCMKDGFVVERDGIIKVANAAREVPRCRISFLKRKSQDSA